MRIQDLESITGLDRPTIRYYEKEGLIVPQRSENGYRSYSDTDAEALIRIKLMRQLGVSIWKIKELQMHPEVFAVIVEEQVELLSSQIDRDERARKVCTTILADKAEYRTINSSYYLEMFNQMTKESVTQATPFQESLTVESHPWRRFFARSMDYFLLGAIINFVIFVIFRLRLDWQLYKVWNVISPIIIGGLFIHVEAFLIHFFGTTPGKLAMGIRIERIEGGYLSFEDALERSKMVYLQGVALKIPVICEIIMLKRYFRLAGKRSGITAMQNGMDWDYNNELHYDRRRGRRYCALICILILGISLLTITVTDLVKPKFRTDTLTLAEFSCNYNNLANILITNPSHTDLLQSNGSWREAGHQGYVVYVGAIPEIENKNFSYNIKNGIVRSVMYSQCWTDVSILDPIGVQCNVAAITLLASQKYCSYIDILEFQKIWNDAKLNSIADFQYKNIRVQWEIIAENGLERTDDFFIASNSNNNTKLLFEFSVSYVNE